MTTTTDHQACQVCGVATDNNIERRYTRTPAGQPTPYQDYDVGTCSDCLTLDPSQPGLAVRAALRVLGKQDSDLAAEAFLDAGVDVTAVLYDSGDPLGGRGNRGPQRKAWAHIDKEGKAALRAGYARLLDLRVHAASNHDRLVPATPPPSGPPACLACGIGTSGQWYSVQTGALTRGPDIVSGCVCDTCAPMLQEVGAVGPEFLERAAMQAKGLDWSDAVRIPQLKAWVATGLPPGEPWSWVDLREPEPDLTPLQALQMQVADLAAKVAALEASR